MCSLRCFRRALPLLLAAFTFMLLAGACHRAAENPVDAAIARTRRGDVNVLFVLVDTLRADHLSAYSYPRLTSPVTDGLASSGIRFARVRSQSSWTKCSMASLWTAQYPVRTGILRHQHALANDITMPAEIFAAAGVETAGIWRNGWVAPNFGFAQGFDVYLRPVPSRAPEKFESVNISAAPLQGTDLDATESALEFIRAYGDRRFLLYLHYMDVHQYLYEQASARFGASYEDAYDNAIHWVDRNVGLLLAGLRERGLLRKTLVVIASDHGEAFAEHGVEGHGKNLYREVTDTPLIVALPEPLPTGIVVESLIENIDIWPTILDLLALPALDGAQGRSLLPLIREAAEGKGASNPAAEGRPAFAQLDRTWGRRDGRPMPLVSVTAGSHQLIHAVGRPGEDQLFDHARDPDEQNNIADAAPALAASLRSQIEAYLIQGTAGAAAPREVELDEMHLEQLRALGYMGGRR